MEAEMEFWDVLDENGNKTGEIAKRKKDFYVLGDNRYHLVVVAWIYNNGKFLCQKRGENKQVDPLKWSIPGGSAYSGESSEYACLREIEEEVGIKLKKEDLIFVERLKRKTDFCDVWLSVSEIKNSDIIINSDEVSDVGWFTYEEILNMMENGNFSPHNEIINVMDLIKNKGNINEQQY